MNEAQIITGLRACSAEAHEALYDEYAGDLYDYCRALLGDDAAAVAALRETLLRAAASTGSMPSGCTLRAWLFALARSQCRRGGDRLIEHPMPEDDPSARLLVAVLGTLTARDREVLELTGRHGLTERDLEPVLGLPPDRVASLVADARRRFDHAMAEELDRTGPVAFPALAGLTPGEDPLPLLYTALETPPPPRSTRPQTLDDLLIAGTTGALPHAFAHRPHPTPTPSPQAPHPPAGPTPPAHPVSAPDAQGPVPPASAPAGPGPSAEAAADPLAAADAARTAGHAAGPANGAPATGPTAARTPSGDSPDDVRGPFDPQNTPCPLDGAGRAEPRDPAAGAPAPSTQPSPRPRGSFDATLDDGAGSQGAPWPSWEASAAQSPSGGAGAFGDGSGAGDATGDAESTVELPAYGGAGEDPFRAAFGGGSFDAFGAAALGVGPDDPSHPVSGAGASASAEAHLDAEAATEAGNAAYAYGDGEPFPLTLDGETARGGAEDAGAGYGSGAGHGTGGDDGHGGVGGAGGGGHRRRGAKRPLVLVGSAAAAAVVVAVGVAFAVGGADGNGPDRSQVAAQPSSGGQSTVDATNRPSSGSPTTHAGDPHHRYTPGAAPTPSATDTAGRGHPGSRTHHTGGRAHRTAHRGQGRHGSASSKPPTQGHRPPPSSTPPSTSRPPTDSPSPTPTPTTPAPQPTTNSATPSGSAGPAD